MTAKRETEYDRKKREKAEREKLARSNGKGRAIPDDKPRRLAEYAGGAPAGEPETSTGEPLAPPEFPVPIPSSELRARADDKLWPLRGILSMDGITLFTALWKSGKSTWLGHLFRAFADAEHAEAEFCGLSILPSRVLNVTEESESVLAMRRDKIGWHDNVRHLVRPFKGKPYGGDWTKFIAYLEDVLKEWAAEVVIFDTISNLWPVKKENDAGEVGEALMPLRRISEGRSLMIVHHPSKADAGQGTASRGSGATAAFVDTIIEMRRFSPEEKDDCRRILSGYGRYDCTPTELAVELQGDLYVSVGDRRSAAAKDIEDAIVKVLPTERPGMTSKEVGDNWPSDSGVRRQAIIAVLQDGAAAGKWTRDGDGKRGRPFTFWRGEK